MNSTKALGHVIRQTKETHIEVKLNLNPEFSESTTLETIIDIDTGIGFFDHMLEAFARHAQIGLWIRAKGDLHIDQHHTVEDVGIVLGQCFYQSLGNLSGIERFGMMECPLDEALSKVVIDISGRPHLNWNVTFHRDCIGTLDSSLVKEFFGGFVNHAKWTIHIDVIRGENDHHICESIFKSFARAAKIAIKSNSSAWGIPSTKGVLV